MRKEFIENRQPIPPFGPATSDKQLAATFDYADYLAVCLGHFLAHIIHLPPLTWGALWVITAAFFIIYIAMSGDVAWVACAWVVVGWLNLLGVMALAQKCNHILMCLQNPSDFPHHPPNFRTAAKAVLAMQRFNICASKSRDDSERDPLNPAAHRLPAWTHVQPQRTPRWLQFLLGDIVPNRHQALFWFGHMGPELHVALLRLHLLLRSVYIALVLAVFTPAIWAEFGFLWAMFYMAVSGFLMWWEYYFVLQDLITCMCHISCSGMLRHNPIVDEVVRKQKTKNAIRAIMMMTTLVHSDHSGAGAGMGTKGLSTHTFDMDPNSSFCASISQEEIAEIGSIYDMYDTDGSGEIDKGELEKVMESVREGRASMMLYDNMRCSHCWRLLCSISDKDILFLYSIYNV